LGKTILENHDYKRTIYATLHELILPSFATSSFEWLYTLASGTISLGKDGELDIHE